MIGLISRVILARSAPWVFLILAAVGAMDTVHAFSRGEVAYAWINLGLAIGALCVSIGLFVRRE